MTKGQKLAKFSTCLPIPYDYELNDDLLVEDGLFIDILLPWKMYLDGAASNDGHGVRIVFVFPEKYFLIY